MMENHSKLLLVGITSITILLIISGLYFVYLNKGGNVQLEIELGDGKSVKIDLQENNKATIQVILETLFEDNKSKRLTNTLLKEYYNLYELDSKLVNAIRDVDPTTEFSKKLRKLLSNMEGPFNREHHMYYNVNSVNVLLGLQKNGENHEVSTKLRMMARDSKPPIFLYETISVHVSLSKRVGNGFASACNGSNYIGRNVILANSDTGGIIQVFVKNTFPCLSQKSNQLRLTNSDASNLYGTTREKQSFEDADMTVAKPGMKFDIVIPFASPIITLQELGT
jgi:hypothetical protein